MSFQKITLQCGEKPLSVERILVQRTYIGLMEGKPSAKDNAEYIDRFRTWVREITDVKAPYVFMPLSDESKGYPRLPEYACAISLQSFEPANDMNADMSYAVVIWFQEQNLLEGSPQIFELLKQIKWKDVAKDGWW